MSQMFNRWLATLLVASLCLLGIAGNASAQSSKVMGEVRFEGATKVERDSGVWIDGGYVGFLKELKGDKKVLLLPGQHQVEVRQSGYDSFVQKIVVEPGEVQTVDVKMHLSPGAHTPAITATLKITVQPGRAAVFLDGQYIGHASELGGAMHSVSISPGKHRVKVELPGYRTFETEVNLLQGQKSEVKTELVKGSIQQASPDIKPPNQ
jgi:PEGA domain